MHIKNQRIARSVLDRNTLSIGWEYCVNLIENATRRPLTLEDAIELLGDNPKMTEFFQVREVTLRLLR